jgi:hypothetical protein
VVTAESIGVRWGEATSSSRRLSFAITTEWVFLVLFVGGLAWVPYWYGSNRLIAWGVNAVLFPGLAALYELSLLARGAPHPVPIKRIRLLAGVFVMVGVSIFLQNVSWVPTAWQHRFGASHLMCWVGR